jgi:hypothetical protein
LKKQNLGQFNTKSSVWLKPQVKEFISHSGCVFGIDPFAGQGDLVKAATELGLKQVMGYDIDPEINKKYGWWWNNSLEEIPAASLGTILITNPPYLAKNSANRNEYESYKYFIEHPEYDDLYQLALFRALAKYKYSVFIIPETYFIDDICWSRNLGRLLDILIGDSLRGQLWLINYFFKLKIKEVKNCFHPLDSWIFEKFLKFMCS